jgi:hypothetical protein
VILSQRTPDPKVHFCVVPEYRAMEVAITVIALPFGMCFPTDSPTYTDQGFPTDVSDFCF